LAALALLVAPAGAQPDRPLGDTRLDALAGRYFDEAWRIDPVSATDAGVHDYDEMLGSFSTDGFDERLDLARRYLDSVKAIDPGTMGAQASYDAQIFASRLESDILSLGTLEPWKHDPAYYTGVASDGIYSLLARNFAPLAVRVRAVVAREKQIPAMLAAGEANLTTVDAVTATIARENVSGAIDFFANDVPAGVAGLPDAGLRAQFASANAGTVAALRAYLAALDAGVLAHPSGTFAIGAANFTEELRLQELVAIPLSTYESVGEAALAKSKAEFLATAKAIDATKSPQAVVLELRSHHPAASQLLASATSDIVALRHFVVAHDILTLPPDDDVKVVETPPFARSTTFASMDAPGALEKHSTQAYFNVTPVEPGWSAERKEQHLGFFNDYGFPLIGAHEVMPGHYVNYALDVHEKLSLIRQLITSPSFGEGWAHYDEQMMVDEGWGNGDPRVRLAELSLALQRECRLLVGLREHTQNMSVEAATTFFEENAFMEAEPARREALRGTADPLYGYYTLGKLELLKLRDDYRKSSGSHYSLQAFHDSLLANGDPPIAIVRKIVLGADDDGKLL
jgi:Bacterial protein of unknown function (DUF885)